MNSRGSAYYQYGDVRAKKPRVEKTEPIHVPVTDPESQVAPNKGKPGTRPIPRRLPW